MKQTKIINFIGGPCCGKSTTAAGLFAQMKLDQEYSVELVTETVKDYVYDECTGVLDDQLMLTATQNHSIKRLIGKVDFIITDASIINGIIYNKFYNKTATDIDLVLNDLIKTLIKSYDNYFFILPRKKKYDQYGRTQTEEQAKEIDVEFDKGIIQLLNEGVIKHESVFNLKTDKYDNVQHADIPNIVKNIITRGDYEV